MLEVLVERETEMRMCIKEYSRNVLAMVAFSARWKGWCMAAW